MSPFWSVPSIQRFSVCSRDCAAVTTVPSLTIFSFSVTHKGTLQWPPENIRPPQSLASTNGTLFEKSEVCPRITTEAGRSPAQPS